MADKTLGHRDPVTGYVDRMECVLVPLREVNLSTCPPEGLPIELGC